MGDAPLKTKTVSLIVRELAHVDEAWTAHGFVSKIVPLELSESNARRLLAAHPYLTTMGGETNGRR